MDGCEEFAAALEAIVSPAYFVDGDAVVVAANAAGRASLARDGARAAALLRRAVRPQRSAEQPDCKIIRVGGPGRSPHYLVVEASLDRFAERDARVVAASARWKLTKRQAEVLALVAEGLSIRAMAAQLGCAEKTVETHLTTMLEKAQVETRAELAARVWMV